MVDCEECKDYRETFERIVANDTAKDEVHCGCCVQLRAEVLRLRARLEVALQEENKRHEEMQRHLDRWANQ